MHHSVPRTLRQLDRQLNMARQLRSEAIAGGVARAVQQLSMLLRRMAAALRGTHGLSIPSWRG